MEIKKYLSSGIIEMYCMGHVSDEEKKQLEKLASEHPAVRDEIALVYETLDQYARYWSKLPPASLKNKIINVVLNSESKEKKLPFPPRITADSTAKEWFKYISDNNIFPDAYDELWLLDLPGNETQVTYLAWAKKGVVVEESHENEDEYLLMLKGRCSVTIDGKVGYYKEGDVIFIPAKSIHRAEALSDEPMVLVGQRIAA